MTITLEITLHPEGTATREEICQYIEFELGGRGEISGDVLNRAADTVDVVVAT